MLTQAAAGGHHLLALDEDGHVWTWETGQSEGFASHPITPTRLAAGVTFTQIAAGGAHSLAVDGNGRTWVWGANFHGQLGDGGTDGSAIPVMLDVDATFVDMAADDFVSLAVDTEGRLWAWGRFGYPLDAENTVFESKTPLMLTV